MTGDHMNNKPGYRTPRGRVLTDKDVEALAAEVATTDYDVRTIRRRGRPSLGAGPSRLVPVRLDPGLHEALTQRADDDETTASHVIRSALRAYLGQP